MGSGIVKIAIIIQHRYGRTSTRGGSALDVVDYCGTIYIIRLTILEYIVLWEASVVYCMTDLPHSATKKVSIVQHSMGAEDLRAPRIHSDELGSLYQFCSRS